MFMNFYKAACLTLVVWGVPVQAQSRLSPATDADQKAKQDSRFWEASADRISKENHQLVLIAVPGSQNSSLTSRTTSHAATSIPLTGSVPQTWNNILCFSRDIYREWTFLKTNPGAEEDQLISFLDSLSPQQLKDVGIGKALDLKSLTSKQVNLFIAMRMVDPAALKNLDNKKLSIFLVEPAAYVFFRGSFAPETMQEMQSRPNPAFPDYATSSTKLGGATPKIVQALLKDAGKMVAFSSATSWSLQEVFQHFRSEFKDGTVKVVAQAQPLRVVISGGNWKLGDLLSLCIQAAGCEARPIEDALVVGPNSTVQLVTSQINRTRSMEMNYQKLLMFSRILLKSPKSLVPNFLVDPMMDTTLIPYIKLTKLQKDWLSQSATAPADFLLQPPNVNAVEVALVPMVNFEIDSPVKSEGTYTSTSLTTHYSWFAVRTKSKE